MSKDMLEKMNMVRLKAEQEAHTLQEEIQRTLREAEAERQAALNSMVQGAAARLGGQVAKVTTLGRQPSRGDDSAPKEPHTPGGVHCSCARTPDLQTAHRTCHRDV